MNSREADFVVIWRAGNEPDVLAAIAAVRKGKAKLLVDIDDLMLVPEIASELVIDGIRSQQHDSREVGLLFLRVREVLAQADACVCTTDELAKHAQAHGQAATRVAERLRCQRAFCRPAGGPSPRRERS